MENQSFSESLEHLQKAADQIGRPATSMEDALKLFDEGMQEYDYLSRILSEAEQKIEYYSDKEAAPENEGL